MGRPLRIHMGSIATLERSQSILAQFVSVSLHRRESAAFLELIVGLVCRISLRV